MEPITENPTDIWARFRGRETSVEELAREQGTKIPNSSEGYLADIMPEDETPEMWNAMIESWRDEERRQASR